MPTTRFIEYTIEGKTYEAFLAAPDHGNKAPTVLICHAWAGRSPVECEKAEALAELGYTGIAIDLYGKGVLGSSAEENERMMTPFIEDRQMLQNRLKHILDLVRTQPEVDSQNVAAMGFCFGGLCVLDMARSGAAIKGVVSFHGLLGGPGSTLEKIDAKILALHGWDDPMATPTDVEAFGAEMTKAKADWQLHAYGGVLHAFTNPAANDPDFGTVYDKKSDQRSWIAMQNFLREIFSS